MENNHYHMSFQVGQVNLGKQLAKWHFPTQDRDYLKYLHSYTENIMNESRRYIPRWNRRAWIPYTKTSETVSNIRSSRNYSVPQQLLTNRQILEIVSLFRTPQIIRS